MNNDDVMECSKLYFPVGDNKLQDKARHDQVRVGVQQIDRTKYQLCSGIYLNIPINIPVNINLAQTTYAYTNTSTWIYFFG